MSQTKQEILIYPSAVQNHYKLGPNLFDHSHEICPKFRAKLFGWISQECSKHKVSRRVYVFTCCYLDLFFMNKNDVKQKQDYQYLGLGALILACKFGQNQSSIPPINLSLISAQKLLQMEMNLITGLKYRLNPPNYVQLLNLLALMWDQYSFQKKKFTEIKYFTYDNKSSNRILVLYEQMDYLYLNHEILAQDLLQLVLTLFYVKTKFFNFVQKSKQQIKIQNIKQQILWKIKADPFQKYFATFLKEYKINITIQNLIVQKIISLKNIKYTQVKEQITKQELIQKVNAQTYNPYPLFVIQRHYQIIQLNKRRMKQEQLKLQALGKKRQQEEQKLKNQQKISQIKQSKIEGQKNQSNITKKIQQQKKQTFNEKENKHQNKINKAQVQTGVQFKQQENKKKKLKTKLIKKQEVKNKQK